ncbi:hypothetical protein MUTS15_75810 (plasmid) [Escherichia coli]|nr:hypothetical protein MUTS15_75810 [Escherichia coli]BDZ06434.1 hypothetical protein MUTS16_75070 [Escherichia coli]
MRISNIEWLKKRIGFIRKLGEQTARQRQIIDLIDNEAGLTEQERKLLHVLATAEKRLTGTGERTKTGGPKTNRGKNNDGNAITGSFSRLGY